MTELGPGDLNSFLNLKKMDVASLFLRASTGIPPLDSPRQQTLLNREQTVLVPCWGHKKNDLAFSLN